ncbi:HAD family hydrolase [Halosegnis marinus]|uniref:HAD family hydrolase n=1 Tax=Halosegnis marinus TaxID=3034023 RepID=A0ABD5ZSR7_9EURY|nr:HAD family hydrolase [Halosegnis sp. DT85]
MTRYDAVFFDLGGVVVELKSIREGYALFVERLTEEYDLPEDALDRWKSALGAHFKGREGTEYRTAREGYRKATTALFDGSPPPEAEWRAMLEAASDETTRPEPGAVEAVRGVAELGVHVGVVSDIDTAEAHDLLDRFGIEGHVDAVTTSEAVGHTKPDARMYEDALAKWGGDAADGVMVGDRYDHDVAGAVDAGLDAIAYGPDAYGPKATHEIADMREVPGVVRGE